MPKISYDGIYHSLAPNAGDTMRTIIYAVIITIGVCMGSNGYTQPPDQHVNTTTLQSYQEAHNEYMANTPHQVCGLMQEWIDMALSYVTPSQNILEIGSGFGRDAAYMHERGYTITCSDATPAFVTTLQECGLHAVSLNILTDVSQQPYDMVFANAVLLHFTPHECATVIKNVHDSLQENGIFAFSVKEGYGDEWLTTKLNKPRYFCYWQAGTITAILQEQGFEIVQCARATSSTKHETWLYIIARKTESASNHIPSEGSPMYRIFKQNKLWRDKCIALLEQGGSRINWYRLNDVEFDRELRLKLQEEAEEVTTAKTRSELLAECADVQEILDTLCALHGITKEELVAVQTTKREEKGGFAERMYVETAEHKVGSFGERYCLAQPEKYPEIV